MLPAPGLARGGAHLADAVVIHQGAHNLADLLVPQVHLQRACVYGMEWARVGGVNRVSG